MAKLGKKNYEIIQTVEAYYDSCRVIDCYCTRKSTRNSLNEKLYNAAYEGQ